MALPDRKYLTHKPQEQRNLSLKANSNIDLNDGKWVFQSKHDGCQIMILVGVNVVRIFSREGKEAVSLPHIAEHFRLNSHPNMVYFGEVWHSDQEFKDISGKFRRQSPQYDLEAWLFDSVTLQEFRAGASGRPYCRRLQALSHVLNATAGVYPVIQRFDIESLAAAITGIRAETGLKFGLDGMMAKHVDGPWKAGIDNEGYQLKLKDVLSVDLEIVDLIEGEGKFAGMTGALQVKWKGTIATVSGGRMTNDDRVFWWEHRQQIKGKIAEVHALGTTPDGKLREPRFQRLRDDKTEPSE